MTLRSSSQRGSFQKDAHIESKAKQGKEASQDLLDMFASIEQQKRQQELDPEWQKDNLEYDLRSCGWICDKVKNSEFYAQNLYAAMCNNHFQRNETWPVLKDKRWSCSWRYAGGIIADMREQGDYIDWYCSGINDGATLYENKFVSESVVTPEIEEDLFRLGWIVIKD